ncbi:MAG: hypothetical protein DMH00_07240 [Acidobacteria bacterium]|nr:MAG: hypothetical protein DMH00_07240 [Acidobacteriota bacterium]
MLRQGKASRRKGARQLGGAARALSEHTSNQEVVRSRPPGLSVLVGALILLGAFFAQGLAFLGANSQTSDEAVHLAAGYSYLARGDFRLNPEHPPFIKEISALPVFLGYRIPFRPDDRLWGAAEEWKIGRDFLYRSPLSWDRILFAARIPDLILGLILVGLVGLWSYRLWGGRAALLAMAMAAFEPNLIANASLVTTDLGAALFTFLTLYLLWEYAAAPAWRLLAGAGIATGLALASKYSTVILLPIAGMVILGEILFCGGEFPLPPRSTRVKQRIPSGPAERVARAIAPFIVLVVVAASVIPVVYLFQGFSTWWIGFGQVLVHQQEGHHAFFLGEYSTQGWWSYFPVAFLVKTPVGTLMLMLASLILCRRGASFRRKDVLYLLVPVAILFLAAARGRINIGLRHILPVYPLLMVAASRLATLRFPSAWTRALALGTPVAFTAISSLSVAPHQLAYFNEVVGGPDRGSKYLSDSNIDWGQDLLGLKAFMDREKLPMIYLAYFGNTPPAALGIRYQYAPAFGHLERPPQDVMPPGIRREILAISVCSLQGVHLPEKDAYAWLAQRPRVGSIGYSIYLYDLTSDASAHLNLAKTYLRVGPAALAVPELRKVLMLDPRNVEAESLLASLESRS